MTQRIKWLGLIGLAVVWFALLYVFVIDVPPPQEVPLKFTSGQSTAATAPKGPIESWEVRSLHARARELPGTPKKNIFAAAALPLSPEALVRLVALKKKKKEAAALPRPEVTQPPPAPSPEELARQQEELAAQAARQQEELRRKQLQEQMAQYRYLGSLYQNGVQKVFLGKGSEIYIIRQGDKLEGKFLVALIEATAVKILESESKLETIIKLKKEEGSASGT